MKLTKTLQITAILAGLSAFSFTANSDTFYKWVDENGTTHYGSKPPKEHASKPIHTAGRASGPESKMAPIANKEEAPKEGESNENSTVYDAEELAKYCKSIKDRLSLMTTRNQIKQKNADGSVVMLTEEQRQEQISSLQKSLSEKCK